MSFIKLDKRFFEHSTVTLKPTVKFISSSVGAGVTGSEFVSPVRSKCIKNAIEPASFSLNNSRPYDEVFSKNLFNLSDLSKKIIRGNTTNVEGAIKEYLNEVASSSNGVRFSKTIDAFRFDMPVSYNKNFNIKNNLRKVLIPFHQHRYAQAGFHYSNYHTLNFYTSDTVPNDSALMYPNLAGQYNPEGALTLDFWINPRYDNKQKTSEFNAGTIFHMSSSMCVSLISGSERDEKDLTSDFKILVQISQSADLNPKNVNYSSLTYPNDLIFTSSNTIKKNHWAHVSLQWSPNNNNSVARLVIDDTVTNFSIPSSSIIDSDNEVITIGNYLDTNSVNASLFFNSTKASSDGLTQLNASANEPASQATALTCPLNAEIHDVKLFNKYLNDLELKTIKNNGINANLINSVNLYSQLLFYVPPFFYPITRPRDVFVTPFQTITGSTTNDPFNVQFSFGVNGKMINLENFTREFIKGEFPRLQALTGSTLNSTIQNITADQFIYSSGSLIKRNTTILPNDNGLFKPDFYPIQTSPASSSNSYRTSGQLTDYSKIQLYELIPTASLFPGLIAQQGPIFDQVVGSSPENPGVSPGSVLTVAQRTKDVSSNEISIIDISNLYYGNQIHPGSFSITDDNLTGSSNAISIKLTDNKEGSLYRSDCLTEHAKWNNVGDIFYDEGIVFIKSPNLLYFCKDRTQLDFKGEQNIHTMIMNIPFEFDQFNSSSNETYRSLTPTDNINDQKDTSIYISSVNIHDDNFNIIMKAHFSQPILKTDSNEFVVRLKMDF